MRHYQTYPYVTPGGGDQLGHGNIFSAFLKRAIPKLKSWGESAFGGLVKSAGKSLLKTGAATSSKILGDIAAGKKIQDSAAERLEEAGTEIKDKVTEKIKKMRGKGRRRRRVAKRLTAKKRRVSQARTTKRRGGAQAGSGRRRRRTTTKRKAPVRKKRTTSVKRHRRRDVFTA
jgi:hypothetical protein